MPSFKGATQQQRGQARSTTLPVTNCEAQKGQQVPGPPMQHQSSSSHIVDHARQYEQQEGSISAKGQPTLQMPDLESRIKQFVDFLKLTWIDLLFVSLTYIISGALWFWGPIYRADRRKIPLWYDPYKQTWYGPLSLSCQKQPDVISSTHTGLVVTFGPLAVVVIVQLFTRSFWDAHHANFGLLKALAVM